MMDDAVLVVEDDAVAAQAVTAMLESRFGDGIEVLSVDRVSRAEQLLLEAPVTCVLLDLGLPDSAGLEGMRRLIRASPEVPIVVLTATDDELLAAQAIQEGARDYVPKSAATADVLERLLRGIMPPDGGDGG